MVQNGAHKCSRKSESHVEEDNTISEVRKFILATLSVFFGIFEFLN